MASPRENKNAKKDKCLDDKIEVRCFKEEKTLWKDKAGNRSLSEVTRKLLNRWVKK